jgi:hypothetical protein
VDFRNSDSSKPLLGDQSVELYVHIFTLKVATALFSETDKFRLFSITRGSFPKAEVVNQTPAAKKEGQERRMLTTLPLLRLEVSHKADCSAMAARFV